MYGKAANCQATAGYSRLNVVTQSESKEVAGKRNEVIRSNWGIRADSRMITKARLKNSGYTPERISDEDLATKKNGSRKVGHRSVDVISAKKKLHRSPAIKRSHAESSRIHGINSRGPDHSGTGYLVPVSLSVKVNKNSMDLNHQVQIKLCRNSVLNDCINVLLSDSKQGCRFDKYLESFRNDLTRIDLKIFQSNKESEEGSDAGPEPIFLLSKGMLGDNELACPVLESKFLRIIRQWSPGMEDALMILVGQGFINELFCNWCTVSGLDFKASSGGEGYRQEIIIYEQAIDFSCYLKWKSIVSKTGKKRSLPKESTAKVSVIFSRKGNGWEVEKLSIEYDLYLSKDHIEKLSIFGNAIWLNNSSGAKRSRSIDSLISERTDDRSHCWKMKDGCLIRDGGLHLTNMSENQANAVVVCRNVVKDFRDALESGIGPFCPDETYFSIDPTGLVRISKVMANLQKYSPFALDPVMYKAKIDSGIAGFDGRGANGFYSDVESKCKKVWLEIFDDYSARYCKHDVNVMVDKLGKINCDQLLPSIMIKYAAKLSVCLSSNKSIRDCVSVIEELYGRAELCFENKSCFKIIKDLLNIKSEVYRAVKAYREYPVSKAALAGVRQGDDLTDYINRDSTTGSKYTEIQSQRILTRLCSLYQGRHKPDWFEECLSTACQSVVSRQDLAKVSEMEAAVYQRNKETISVVKYGMV